MRQACYKANLCKHVSHSYLQSALKKIAILSERWMYSWASSNKLDMNESIKCRKRINRSSNHTRNEFFAEFEGEKSQLLSNKLNYVFEKWRNV